MTTEARPGSYSSLDAMAVRDTVDRLQQRIAARFPNRNLRNVCSEISDVIDDLLIRPESPWYGVLRIVSRVAMIAVALSVLVGVVVVVRQTAAVNTPSSIWEWVQIVESAVNDTIFVAVAIWFLWELPGRVQRRHDLASLHRLRSLAHVIDMHQLTKDPERLRTDFRRTSRTLELGMSASDLGIYLDYCSEMLSLLSKTAALFAQDSDDPAVVSAVEGVEALTTGMSRKIWQKIALLPSAPGDDHVEIVRPSRSGSRLPPHELQP